MMYTRFNGPPGLHTHTQTKNRGDRQITNVTQCNNFYRLTTKSSSFPTHMKFEPILLDDESHFLFSFFFFFRKVTHWMLLSIITVGCDRISIIVDVRVERYSRFKNSDGNESTAHIVTNNKIVERNLARPCHW